jgi:hypothetical protein
MWDYESIHAKALTYFGRAEEHPVADDDEFALWSLLGLEFLLRAPLARVNPCLLAEPEGDSLLAACGYATGKAGKSVGTATVIKRLSHVVPGFEQRQEDANFLINLRNAELHSGDAALASMATAVWLPRLYRVVEAIAAHLGATTDEVLGSDVAAQASSLVDAENKKVQQDVAQRRNQCRRIFEALQPDEVSARRQPPFSGRRRPDAVEVVPCPACATDGALKLAQVRRTNERIQDDVIYYDDIYVAENYACSVCGFALSGIAEVAAAGLNQVYTRPQEESVSERYMSTYEGEDYGND